VVCERVLGRQGLQPFAEADDLGTIRGAFRRDRPIIQIGYLIDPLAAIARMVAKTAGYQQVDLASINSCKRAGCSTRKPIPACALRNSTNSRRRRSKLP